MSKSKEKIKSVAESVIAGIITINPITNAVAASVSSYMTARRERQQQNFLAQIRKKVDELASHIDIDYFQTEEFCAMASKAFLKIMMDLREEKARMYATLLVCSAVDQNIKSDDKFMFLETLDKIDESHLLFLHKLMGRPCDLSSSVMGWTGSIDECKLINVPENVFEMYCDYLASIGLISRLNHFEINADGHLIEQVHFVVSKYGVSLLNFLK